MFSLLHKIMKVEVHETSHGFKLNNILSLQVETIHYYQSPDVTLISFLEGYLPTAQKKCSHPQCGELPMSHMVSYLHNTGSISFTMTEMPNGTELPGAEKCDIWFWARPEGVRILTTSPPCFGRSIFSNGVSNTTQCSFVHLSLSLSAVLMRSFLQFLTFSRKSLRGRDLKSGDKLFKGDFKDITSFDFRYKVESFELYTVYGGNRKGKVQHCPLTTAFHRQQCKGSNNRMESKAVCFS